MINYRVLNLTQERNVELDLNEELLGPFHDKVACLPWKVKKKGYLDFKK